MIYTGTIIAESLENKDILSDLKIIRTEVETATEEHKTPWVHQWTLHTVEIPEDRADDVAEKISHALDSKHAWYEVKKSSMVRKLEIN